MKLSLLIKQNRFSSPAQETVLNVIVTSNWLVGELALTLMPHEITPVQYNVLRILHGASPKKRTCNEIGERLLDRTPDVTRLLDRLERMSLIRRHRAKHDRRVVEVEITSEGMDLVNVLGPKIEAVQAGLLRHLSDDEQKTLSALLEKLRSDQTA